jgi:2,3-bisphosphoglycerate-dependent phosphoglycerate mutase
MKILLSLLLSMGLINLQAQTNTYILIRHAEKDTTQKGSTAMQANPPLSAEGELRAKRLPNMLKAYKLDSIYSTNYTRTKATVAHIAAKHKLEPNIYDAKKLEAFASQLLALQNKTVLIVGHSNTTPQLVNFLIKENKYKALDESVYSKVFIVTVKDGKAFVEEREY